MSRVPLSDDETRVVFSEEATANLSSLDADQQEQILRRLLNIAESQSPPSTFVREQIANLDIIAAGDQCRLYATTADSIPRGNAEYHAIFVFYIDESHDYDQADLREYSELSQRWVEQIRGLETVTNIEAMFEREDALSPDDLRDLLP